MLLCCSGIYRRESVVSIEPPGSNLLLATFPEDVNFAPF